jgi:ribosomal protein S12 methylthiotransferase
VTSAARRVALVTLGCARNEVDSEELAGRLGADGWELTDSDDAEILIVNTCGFIESAKQDSIDTLLAASDTGKKVVAVGCLAQRYGEQLAASLPEADAILSFDDYPDIAARLTDILAGKPHVPHVPVDRRTLLPISPVKRPHAAEQVSLPGHAWLPNANRKRLVDSPSAYLKLASGCDRKCTFCAIPSFRGAFVSRPPEDVLGEAMWLASTGVHELVLVSENSTSYGKDLGDLTALERLLPQLSAIEGIERVLVSYLQPAELRPGLLEAIATTPGVAPYFDLSFQHASEPVLRRMRRFGSTEAFLDLLSRARALAPNAGARSNFIVGFPGETEADVAELERFLTSAGLDLIGIFGYSDEDGTDAVNLPGKLDDDEIAARVARITSLAEELMSQRAEERIGETVRVLIESFDDDTGEFVGRAEHQGPDVDGVVRLTFAPAAPPVGADLGGVQVQTRPAIGAIVVATVIDTEGIDLLATVGEPAA